MVVGEGGDPQLPRAWSHLAHHPQLGDFLGLWGFLGSPTPAPIIPSLTPGEGWELESPWWRG